MTTDQRKPFAPTRPGRYELRDSTIVSVNVVFFECAYTGINDLYWGQGEGYIDHGRARCANKDIIGFAPDDREWCLARARELAQAHGFAVAPREPTEAMWIAGRDPVMARDLKLSKEDLSKGGISHAALNAEVWFKPEIDGSQDGRHPTKGDTAVWVYRAMIAAAATGEGK